MSERLHGMPARNTATVSLLVAATVGVVLGWGAGVPLASALAVAGGLALGVGAWGLNEPATLRQAGGSVAAVLGALLLVVAPQVGPVSVVLLPIGVAVALVAIESSVGSDSDWVGSLATWMRTNVVVFLLAAVVVAAWSLTATHAVPVLLGLWSGAVGQSTLVDLVIVQCLLVAISLLLSVALPVLDRWVPRSGDDERSVLAPLRRISLTTETLPIAYLAVLGVQAVLGFVPWIDATFERFFGPVLAPVLGTAIPQGMLLLVALGLVGVIVAGRLQQALVTALGDDPSTTLAVAGGGTLAVLCSLVLDLALVAGVVSAPGIDWVTIVGVTPVLTTGLAALVIGVGVVPHVVWTLPNSGFLPDRGTGYAIGSAVLCLTALAGGLGSTPAVAVFVGVAGAICCWDLGSHAIDIGRQLGSQARTDRAEFVHVSATTAVLAGAVVLVTAVHTLLVPTLSPGGGPQAANRALLGLGGLAVAMVALFAATHLREREA